MHTEKRHPPEKPARILEKAYDRRQTILANESAGGKQGRASELQMAGPDYSILAACYLARLPQRRNVACDQSKRPDSATPRSPPNDSGTRWTNWLAP